MENRDYTNPEILLGLLTKFAQDYKDLDGTPRLLEKVQDVFGTIAFLEFKLQEKQHHENTNNNINTELQG